MSVIFTKLIDSVIQSTIYLFDRYCGPIHIETALRYIHQNMKKVTIRFVTNKMKLAVNLIAV